MKKLLIIASLLCYINSYGQQPIGTFSQPNQSRGIVYKGMMSLVEQYLPQKDTLWTPIQPGELTFWKNQGIDSVMWLWDGRKWNRQGNTAYIAGYGLVFVGNTIKVDTTQLLTINRFNNTLDTLTSNNITQTDINNYNIAYNKSISGFNIIRNDKVLTAIISARDGSTFSQTFYDSVGIGGTGGSADGNNFVTNFVRAGDFLTISRAGLADLIVTIPISEKKDKTDSILSTGYTSRGRTQKIVDSIISLLSLKLNISDTTAMLSPYLKVEIDPTVSSIIKAMPVSADATTNKYYYWNNGAIGRQQISYSQIAGTPTLDLTGYVTKAGIDTITGLKRFTNNVVIGNDYNGYGNVIKQSTIASFFPYMVLGTNFIPSATQPNSGTAPNTGVRSSALIMDAEGMRFTVGEGTNPRTLPLDYLRMDEFGLKIGQGRIFTPFPLNIGATSGANTGWLLGNDKIDSVSIAIGSTDSTRWLATTKYVRANGGSGGTNTAAVGTQIHDSLLANKPAIWTDGSLLGAFDSLNLGRVNPAWTDSVNNAQTFIKAARLINDSTALKGFIDGKEPSLGNPSTSGYVLSSTTAGVRSWVAGGTGSGATNLDALTDVTITAPITNYSVIQYDTATTQWKNKAGTQVDMTGVMDKDVIRWDSANTKFIPQPATQIDMTGIQNNNLIKWDSANKKFIPTSATSSGSGVVTSGTINRLPYYAASGSTLSELPAITASRALSSDANGLPVASATTATELGYVNGVTSSIQTQLTTNANNISTNTSNIALKKNNIDSVNVDGYTSRGWHKKGIDSLAATLTNIYNSDGYLAGNRILNTNNNSLSFVSENSQMSFTPANKNIFLNSKIDANYYAGIDINSSNTNTISNEVRLSTKYGTTISAITVDASRIQLLAPILYVSALDTDETPPTQFGTIKMVTTDNTGKLSMVDMPTTTAQLNLKKNIVDSSRIVATDYVRQDRLTMVRDSVQANVNANTTTINSNTTNISLKKNIADSVHTISTDYTTQGRLKMVVDSAVSGKISANQTITLSGDISGSGTTAITTTLPTVNSNVGTFNNLTVNAKGQVTAGSNTTYLTAETDPKRLTTLGVTGTTTKTITATLADATTVTTNFTDNNSIDVTNLALGTATTSTQPITNSNGTGITLPTFSTTAGLVPGTTSNTTNFLRADGTFAAPPAGTGTVQSVSVTTANGVSGTVATATTTPAISLTLGAITPTSVAASGTVIGSNLSGTNTGDQTSVSGTSGNVTGIVIGANGGTGIANTGKTITLGGNLTTSGAFATTLTTTAATNVTLPTTGTLATTSQITGTNSGTNTGDQTISITGDVTATGSTGALSATVTKINGTSLAGLTTGILKNTTTTGVPSIAIVRTDYAEPTNALATGLLKNTTTTGAHTIAVAGTDYVVPNAAITGATNTKITYDAKGLVTAGAALVAGDIPNIAESQVTNLTTDLAAKMTNPMTTLGDVISGGASGTPTRLAGNTTATKQFLTSTGSAGAATAPSYGTIAAGDIPTLNQNTTGSAGSFTGSLSGDVTGTQGATVVGKINGTSLAGLTTGILKNTTTTGVPSIAVAADFPTLNQSTTGNASTVTTNANLTGDVTSSGNATTYNNVVGSTKGGAGTVSGIMKANGSGTVSAAVSGTDYLTPSGSAASLTSFPTFNQNTTGIASNITGVLNATSFPALTGDVTNTSGTVATTIANNVVTNAKLAQMAANTIRGNNTAGTANGTDLTATQATAMLNTFTASGASAAKGLVPAPSTTAGTTAFLREDGTWVVPAGSGSGDMVLATAQTVTGAKTFNNNTLVLAGSTSGTLILQAKAIAGAGTAVIPSGNIAAFSDINLDTLTDVTFTGPILDKSTLVYDSVPAKWKNQAGTQIDMANVVEKGLIRYDTLNKKFVGIPLITASRVLVSDATNLPIASITTATELSYVNGVTSAIQTQLNAKLSSETDPVVKAINGIVKSNGTAIAVAVSGTDYALPNANTTGSAATLTTTRNIAGVGFNGSSNIELGGVYVGTQTLTTGTTYTSSAGVTKIIIRMVGGGGGGGGVTGLASQAAAAGGGGGGAYLEKAIAVTAATAYTIAIGAAGAVGASTGTAGGNGGSTTITIGATTYTAPGGTGGSPMLTGVTLITSAGGAGGAVSTNGDINSGGAPGNGGFRLSASAGLSGNGGSSQFGSGGVGISSASTAGNAGLGFGSGGSGAANVGNAAATGGLGKVGAIVITEYR